MTVTMKPKAPVGAVIAMLLIAFAFYGGHELGERHVRKLAVISGRAEWVPEKNGSAKWKWRECDQCVRAATAWEYK